MADNATAFDVVDITVTDLNATSNGTVATPGIFDFFEDVNYFFLELQLILSAIGIIYLSAHAALRRPPSALVPGAGTKAERKKKQEDENFTQGLMPSDAIMFPILAAIMLIGLYYLIQWLQDPALLNKILRWYMSTMSIASLLTLYAHGTQLFFSFLFPRYWRSWNGSVRKVDQENKSILVCDEVGNTMGGLSTPSNPCPAVPPFLAKSDKIRNAIWDARDFLTQDWRLKLHMRGFISADLPFQFAHVTAFLLSLATAIVYFSTSSTFLSNMLGYGMCYGSLLVISPTDFLTSALVLSGLFIYDIVMVFYTPYMITVATKLDVPIKLTFEAASRKSILGLGDIVIPGIVIAWALRFDLWMHYVRKIKYESIPVQIIEKHATSGEVVTRRDIQSKEVKAPYLEAKGTWCEWLWLQSFSVFSRTRQYPPEISASSFSKIYFHASVIGYIMGMLVTLSMLLIFKHGQPALLYLVPGVLGSIILTALIRGELRKLWSYTEDGSLDTVDEIVVLDGEGNAVKRIGEIEDGIVDTTKRKDDQKDQEGDKKSKDAVTNENTKNETQSDASKHTKSQRINQIFLLSITAPSGSRA